MIDAPVPARLDARMQRVFGEPTDTIQEIEARARTEFPGVAVVVWEGDPATFRFSYVSGDAERVLGHPCARWIDEPTFWVDHVVHPDDRADAVAYCALATAKGRHHTFEYRAVRAGGGEVWLRDVVCVVLSPRKVAISLRGVMFDVTAEKRDADSERLGPARAPTFAELAALV